MATAVKSDNARTMRVLTLLTSIRQNIAVCRNDAGDIGSVFGDQLSWCKKTSLNLGRAALTAVGPIARFLVKPYIAAKIFGET